MNPYLVSNPELFAKWGQPNNLGKESNGEFRYRCDRCLASWVGPNGDSCYWCHRRWIQQGQDFRQSLLVPEWLTWGKAYFTLSPESQTVWEQTRGFTSEFAVSWQNRLVKGRQNGEITAIEFEGAMNRFEKWMMQRQSQT